MSEHEGQPEVPETPEPEVPAEEEGEKYDGGPIPPVESTEQEN